MEIKIALAGNPNSGKTTLFNSLTGSSQRVGNWPGVTVEKKDGYLKGSKDVVIQDLPGIYSLSPYTLEEVVARDYLLEESPDVILNVVDASNIERNLFLSLQFMETGIPVVIALNMIDIVRKAGDQIDIELLSKALACPVIETSALKGEGAENAALAAAELAKAVQNGKKIKQAHIYSANFEHYLAHIEDIVRAYCPPERLRWFSLKAFERDEVALKRLNLKPEDTKRLEELISEYEQQNDNDAESIVVSERYDYIESVMQKSVKKARKAGSLSASDKIDRIVTNRWLALPIFAAVMFIVYFVSVTTVGTLVTDFTNDVIFGQWIQGGLERFLTGVGAADWLTGLLVNGIVGGVGAVIGFVPQMLVLFLFLSLLEDIGYMARVAFIMDKIFRRFGLSGKSFIPMLIGSGCSVPGIMASRTIENERDRRMTIITTPFIPCGAKIPIIGLFAAALFGKAWWVAPTAYFIGIAAVIISGIILKKTKLFAGDPAPFVMELPSYHPPLLSNTLRSTGERGWSFIKRAGTVILLASVAIWFLSSFSVRGGFGYVEDANASILATIGNFIAPVFRPLGFGFWEAAVATFMGLLAKEEVVGVFGVLFGVSGDLLEIVEEGAVQSLSPIAARFTAASGFSFLIFNLLCAPCFAAMGAIRKEMNSGKWTAFAIGYMCVFAYAFSLVFYQFALLITGAGFTAGTAAAVAVLAIFVWLLARKSYDERQLKKV